MNRIVCWILLIGLLAACNQNALPDQQSDKKGQQPLLSWLLAVEVSEKAITIQTTKPHLKIHRSGFGSSVDLQTDENGTLVDQRLEPNTAYIYRFEANGKIQTQSFATTGIGDRPLKYRFGSAKEVLPQDQSSLLHYLIFNIPAWEDHMPYQTDMSSTSKTIFRVGTTNYNTEAEALAAAKNCTTVCRVFKLGTSQQTQNVMLDTVQPMTNEGLGYWLSGIYEGKSLSQAGMAGKLSEIPIRNRGPIQISISYPIVGNARTINNPDPVKIQTAVNELIQLAAKQPISSYGTSFKYSYSDVVHLTELSQRFGIDINLLLVRIKTDYEQIIKEKRNVVFGIYEEHAFSLNMYQPDLPSDYFGSTFSLTDLQPYINEGKVGTTNPPVMLSRIDYGRLAVFSLSSLNHTEQIKQAISFGLGNSAADCQGTSGVVLSNCQQQLSVFQTSTIYANAVGFDQTAVVQAVQKAAMAPLFTKPLSSVSQYVPVRYQFSSLRDGVPAAVKRTSISSTLKCTKTTYINYPLYVPCTTQEINELNLEKARIL